jgi:ATP/maltotriose-dependent transcriptional regulator MalT
MLYHDQGEDTHALKLGQQALAIAQELDTTPVQAYALTAVAHAQVGLGQLKAAAGAYRQALAIRREMGQHSLAMEVIAGLARVALVQDDLDQAQAHVDDILRYLEAGSLDGALAPFLVYLTCYRVFNANQHPRARKILETAYQRLKARAAKISHPELHHSFLYDVPSHAQIVQAWETASS